jgi:hypothetical protein
VSVVPEAMALSVLPGMIALVKLRRLREGDVPDDGGVVLTLEEMAQQVPLVRFDHLTLIRVASIIRAGLRLEPTGRNPRHYTVGFDDLDKGVQQIAICGHQVVPNLYHDA